jgi:hypothetical protein
MLVPVSLVLGLGLQAEAVRERESLGAPCMLTPLEEENSVSMVIHARYLRVGCMRFRA